MKDKLIEKLKEYIEFLGECYGNMALFCQLHHCPESDENIDKGITFRNEIASLESELAKEQEPKRILSATNDNPFGVEYISQEPEGVTAEKFLFSKYPLVSKEWFKDNELTQEMIMMMEAYASSKQR